MFTSLRLVGLTTVVSSLAIAPGFADERRAKVDFKTEIRPILSNRCFACHGPDENTVEVGLRLDTREPATQTLESGTKALVPGDFTRSEIVRCILSNDEEIRMLPPHFRLDRLTYRFQGRDYRLTDVHGNVVQALLA